MNDKPKHGWIYTLIFSIVSIVYISPILMIFMNSFKKKAYINRMPFSLPNEKTFVGLENYVEGLRKTGFFSAFGYSLFITITSVVVILLCTSMCAWYISRVHTWYTKAIYMLCLISMVVPFQMVMYPLSKISDSMRLGNPVGIILIYLGFGAGLAVFMFTGFMRSVPIEVEEAAMIDGCNPPGERGHSGDHVDLERLPAAQPGAGPAQVQDHPHRHPVSEGRLRLGGLGCHDGHAGAGHRAHHPVLPGLPEAHHQGCGSRCGQGLTQRKERSC